MSTFTERLDGLLNSEGPNGEPAIPAPPTTSEWVAQRAAILAAWHHFMAWKLHGGPQPAAPGTQPFDTFEAGWDTIPPEDLIRDAHIATYP